MLFKQADRLDKGGITLWVCKFCSVSKMCCAYKTNSTFIFDDYKFRCPKYRGIEEEGVLCAIPNSMDFILSEN